MSSIQGSTPPATPPTTPDGGSAKAQTAAQQQDAELKSDAFSKALNNQQAQQKQQSPNDLFKQGLDSKNHKNQTIEKQQSPNELFNKGLDNQKQTLQKQQAPKGEFNKGLDNQNQTLQKQQSPKGEFNKGLDNQNQTLQKQQAPKGEFNKGLDNQNQTLQKQQAPKGEFNKGFDNQNQTLQKQPSSSEDFKQGLNNQNLQNDTASKGNEPQLKAHVKKNNIAKEEPTAVTSMEGLRSTMGIQMNSTAEVQAVDNKAMIDKIEKIADRIMISNAADVKTVKVDFKDGVLPGTEVVIRKDAAGKINVEFTTTSSESMNFLSRGEQALTETLNRKLGGEIVVDIKMRNADDNQDTGDGRSRQQYVADDDDFDDRNK